MHAFNPITVNASKACAQWACAQKSELCASVPSEAGSRQVPWNLDVGRAELLTGKCGSRCLGAQTAWLMLNTRFPSMHLEFGYPPGRR